MPTITPYKMDIQQGNVVTSEMLLKLRPGMTKSQVQFIMGTPLLVDSFHSDRWDYFYQLRKQGKVINQRRVILDFEGESLARVRGDVVPEGTDIDALMADGKSSASETKPVEAAAIEPVIEVIEEPVIATEAVEAVAEQEKATVTAEPMKDELLDPVPEAVVEAVAPLPEVVDAAGSAQAVAKQKAMQDELAEKEALVKPPVVDAAKLDAAKLEAAKLEAAKLEAAKLEAAKLEEMKVPAPPESEVVSQEVAEPVKRRVKIPAPPVMGPVAKKVKPAPTPALPVAEPALKAPEPVVVPEPVAAPEPELVDEKAAEKVEEVVEVLEETPVARVPSSVEAPKAAKELPTQIPSSITSERRAVLRLERQLDAGRAEQAVPVVETLPAVETEARSNASEVPPKLEPSTDSLPNQEEPGFFERALEKIGF